PALCTPGPEPLEPPSLGSIIPALPVMSTPKMSGFRFCDGRHMSTGLSSLPSEARRITKSIRSALPFLDHRLHPAARVLRVAVRAAALSLLLPHAPAQISAHASRAVAQSTRCAVSLLSPRAVQRSRSCQSRSFLPLHRFVDGGVDAIRILVPQVQPLGNFPIPQALILGP